MIKYKSGLVLVILFGCLAQSLRYDLVETRTTWPDAQAECQRRGGDLVTIPDDETNDHIWGICPQNLACWIGLTRDTFTDLAVNNGGWRWIDGSPVNFLDFGEGQGLPETQEEYASILTSAERKEWVDWPIVQNNLPSICQIYASPEVYARVEGNCVYFQARVNPDDTFSCFYKGQGEEWHWVDITERGVTRTDCYAECPCWDRGNNQFDVKLEVNGNAFTTHEDAAVARGAIDCNVVDCVGQWSAWGDCSASCNTGAGVRSQTYVVSQEAENNGRDCDQTNGDRNTMPCNRDIPCPAVRPDAPEVYARVEGNCVYFQARINPDQTFSCFYKGQGEEWHWVDITEAQGGATRTDCYAECPCWSPGNDQFDIKLEVGGNAFITHEDAAVARGSIDCNESGDTPTGYVCPVTWEGGCTAGLTGRISQLNDKQYSVSDCALECSKQNGCAGFFIRQDNNACWLYEDTCQNDGNLSFKYYDFSQCVAETECESVVSTIPLENEYQGNWAVFDNEANTVFVWSLRTGWTIENDDARLVEILDFGPLGFRIPQEGVVNGDHVYFVDRYGDCIGRFMKSSPYTLEVVFGVPETEGHADGTYANARFKDPSAICTHGKYLYVGEVTGVFRQIDLDNGQVTTVAGAFETQDEPIANGNGANARLGAVQSCACDHNGDVYFTAYGVDSVRKLNTNSGNFEVTDHASGFTSLTQIHADLGNDVLYVFDQINDVQTELKKIMPDGAVSSVSGTNQCPTQNMFDTIVCTENIDGPAAGATFEKLHGMGFYDGHIVLADEKAFRAIACNEDQPPITQGPTSPAEPTEPLSPESSCQWTLNENSVLLGWTSFGPGCYSEEDAKKYCLLTSDCGGISMQPEQCGGTQYTLRVASEATVMEGNYRNFVKSTNCNVHTCEWELAQGSFLTGWSSAGSNCYTEDEAKANCLLTSDCGGITLQDDQCEGRRYTLRRGPTLVAGPPENSFETWVKTGCDIQSAERVVVDLTHNPTELIGENGSFDLIDSQNVDGVVILKMAQLYKGIPVMDASYKEKVMEEQLMWRKGSLIVNIEKDIDSVEPSFEVARRVPDECGNDYGSSLQIHYMNHKANLVYNVECLIFPEQAQDVNGAPTVVTRMLILIDAHTGAYLLKKSHEHKGGRKETPKRRLLATPFSTNGFGGNPKLGKLTRPLKISKDGNDCIFENDDVYTVHNDFLRTTTKTDPHRIPCSDLPDNTDTINQAYSPINDAHFFVTKTVEMMRTTYDYQMTGANGAHKVRVLAHWGNNVNNGYYDSGCDCIKLGDGDGVNTYPIPNDDVFVAHEVGHRITAKTSHLWYSNDQTGGMNEAFSDMIGVALEYYLDPTDVNYYFGHGYQMHRDFWRDFCNPHSNLNGISIGHVNEYRAPLDPHGGSGIFNKWFCILSKKAGWTVEKAFRIVIRAQRFYWTSRHDYQKSANDCVRAASDHGYNTQDVCDAFTDVGIAACVAGCTHSLAPNYNVLATYDDGSCLPIPDGSTACTWTILNNHYINTLTTRFGRMCFDEADAKTECENMGSECGGISMQADMCGGTQYTLRSQTFGISSMGSTAWVKSACHRSVNSFSSRGFFDTWAYRACYITEDSTVKCVNLQRPHDCPDSGWWGQGCGSFGTEKYSWISTGGAFTCGVKIDGTLRCEGLPRDGGTAVPNGKFKQTCAGITHACGLSETGSIYCWGHNIGAPAETDKFKALECGYAYACGIMLDGSLKCWGQYVNAGVRPSVYQDMPTVPVSSPNGFKDIVAGGHRACALDNAGDMYCFGSNLAPIATQPTYPITGPYVKIATTTQWSCGLKADGRPECVGTMPVDMPAAWDQEEYINIQADFVQMCLVTKQRDVMCYGNAWGQFWINPVGGMKVRETCHESGEYYDSATKTCKVCGEDCARCTDDGNCIACANPAHVIKDGHCVLQCDVCPDNLEGTLPSYQDQTMPSAECVAACPDLECPDKVRTNCDVTNAFFIAMRDGSGNNRLAPLVHDASCANTCSPDVTVGPGVVPGVLPARTAITYTVTLNDVPAGTTCEDAIAALKSSTAIELAVQEDQVIVQSDCSRRMRRNMGETFTFNVELTTLEADGDAARNAVDAAGFAEALANTIRTWIPEITSVGVSPSEAKTVEETKSESQTPAESNDYVSMEMFIYCMIGVGGLFVLLILFFISACCCCNKQPKETKETPKPHDEPQFEIQL